ncbi:NADPH-dependent alpha-keto amide reductase, putative [Entamoeba dispar SAW760]|uniref:NADPH-dependent alpha-keto amide reductase, putative n=1 Tax=Entamoeba dispar (strain ATCC PRA-260 / SAW760) TaxID=370354 RepID=B0EIY9_ENTDS|nr:NADPH-dependent alpha-keto amide reductase, putative [Entamoeba dispar SAW760]EDR25522.1 NADPH-dependent alpha-keto amide reductase, putative [Entamoeba dispar SAW760]|eukprot:EDR25522.1 NADPH-dependent alpha-keto amide reductase, putative [Entamoeba dispar SAW760]
MNSYFTLNNGHKIPKLGLGTWMSANGEVAKAVEIAIKNGYRHIDCAKIYGNEKEVGDGIKSAIEKGYVKREELFVTTKLWSTDKHKEDVKPAFEEGLVRSIGVSNFNINKLKELLSIAKIQPAVNQFEFHVYYQRPKLHQFCKEHNIHITGYSPLGNPGYGSTVPAPFENEVVKSIAKKHNKKATQVCIKFTIANGSSVIPKSVHEERIKENGDIFDFELDEDDMEKLRELDKNMKVCDVSFYLTEERKRKEFWDDE